MPQTQKILGQSKPAAVTLTDSYTVPAATTTVISLIVVTNQSATPTSFRISVAINGAADTAAQYIAYDVPILGNETIELSKGVTLDATDVIRVYNVLATCSFNIFGQENS